MRALCQTCQLVALGRLLSLATLLMLLRRLLLPLCSLALSTGLFTCFRCRRLPGLLTLRFGWLLAFALRRSLALGLSRRRSSLRSRLTLRRSFLLFSRRFLTLILWLLGRLLASLAFFFLLRLLLTSHTPIILLLGFLRLLSLLVLVRLLLLAPNWLRRGWSLL